MTLFMLMNLDFAGGDGSVTTNLAHPFIHPHHTPNRRQRGMWRPRNIASSILLFLGL